MESLRVTLDPNHLASLIQGPQTALVELVWNALDADAKHVSIEFDEQELGGLAAIRVVDDGSGITYDEARSGFGSLGSSWTQMGERSAGGRLRVGVTGRGNKGTERWPGPLVA